MGWLRLNGRELPFVMSTQPCLQASSKSALACNQPLQGCVQTFALFPLAPVDCWAIPAIGRGSSGGGRRESPAQPGTRPAGPRPTVQLQRVNKWLLRQPALDRPLGLGGRWKGDSPGFGLRYCPCGRRWHVSHQLLWSSPLGVWQLRSASFRLFHFDSGRAKNSCRAPAELPGHPFWPSCLLPMLLPKSNVLPILK